MATNAAIKLQIGATGPAGPSPSGAQNLVLATPNGSSGVAVLRALVVADLPFTPINKAGDTGIGNLAMGTLSATTLYGLTASPPSAGGMGYQAAQGVLIWAKTGSSYDFCVINPANSLYILYVPTGTVNTVFAGTVSALQLTTTNGYVSSATGNLIFTPPGANSIYMNYGGGTGGVKFCDGTTNVVASMSSAGALTANAVNITGSTGTVSGSLFWAAGGGLQIWPKTGSTYDFSILNAAAGAHILSNPTGTNNMIMPAGGTFTTAYVVGTDVTTGLVIQNIVGTTVQKYIRMDNTGGTVYLGVENSTGTFFGVPAYNACLYSGGHDMSIVAGTITFTCPTAHLPPTMTNGIWTKFSNTSGIFYVGIDSSTGSNFGAGNYATVLYSSANSPMVFFTNGAYRFSIGASGGVAVPAGGTYTDGYITWGSAQMNRTGGYIELQYGGLTGDGVRIFGSKAYPITFDLGTIQQTPVAFASLPTGATGKRGFVNNNSAGAAFGSAANGSGATTYPVYHDGVSWKVG